MKRINSLFYLLLSLLLLNNCKQNPTTTIKGKVMTLFQIDSLKKIECDSLLNRLSAIKADTFGRIKRTPKNFKESLIQLDTLINDEMKQWIICLPDQKFSSYVHLDFGMYIRNKWGLWGNSSLAKNFSKRGILHADDMSGIILDSYQRKLKGEEIKIEDQIKSYKNYWENNNNSVGSSLDK